MDSVTGPDVVDVRCGNGGHMLLPLHGPPLCPFPGRTDCARHLGGCLLARAPDLQNSREWDCLYEVCHFFVFVQSDRSVVRLLCACLIRRLVPCSPCVMGNAPTQRDFMGMAGSPREFEKVICRQEKD